MRCAFPSLTAAAPARPNTCSTCLQKAMPTPPLRPVFSITRNTVSPLPRRISPNAACRFVLPEVSMATAEVKDFAVSSAPPTPAVTRREPEANKLFRMVMKYQASDLHLKAGQPPMMRLRGDIVKVNAPPLSGEDMERLLLPLLSPRQREILDREGGVDFSYVVGDDEARFRVSLFKQRGKLSLVSRRVNSSIPSFKELGLPDSIE